MCPWPSFKKGISFCLFWIQDLISQLNYIEQNTKEEVLQQPIKYPLLILIWLSTTWTFCLCFCQTWHAMLTLTMPCPPIYVIKPFNTVIITGRQLWDCRHLQRDFPAISSPATHWGSRAHTDLSTEADKTTAKVHKTCIPKHFSEFIKSGYSCCKIITMLTNKFNNNI